MQASDVIQRCLDSASFYGLLAEVVISAIHLAAEEPRRSDSDILLEACREWDVVPEEI